MKLEDGLRWLINFHRQEAGLPPIEWDEEPPVSDRPNDDMMADRELAMRTGRVCPTCGSPDRAVRGTSIRQDAERYTCSDPWHTGESS